jgi:hypothetical protein
MFFSLIVGNGRAVPWLRWSDAVPLLRSHGFNPSQVDVGFVVDKVALGQVFSPSSFSPVSIITSMPTLVLLSSALRNITVEIVVK